MKILFLIVLLLFSSSLAEEEFVQLVCSFREDSIPEDTALEGWGSVPFLTVKIVKILQYIYIFSLLLLLIKLSLL